MFTVYGDSIRGGGGGGDQDSNNTILSAGDRFKKQTIITAIKLIVTYNGWSSVIQLWACAPPRRSGSL